MKGTSDLSHPRLVLWRVLEWLLVNEQCETGGDFGTTLVMLVSQLVMVGSELVNELGNPYSLREESVMMLGIMIGSRKRICTSYEIKKVIESSPQSTWLSGQVIGWTVYDGHSCSTTVAEGSWRCRGRGVVSDGGASAGDSSWGSSVSKEPLVA
uniref:Uncharacterized protein n=1 Tax=Tanacetum cinerariifolium TaxID=118510 RepID=A0A6L2PB53_TANCI|nr:hypothetical protein [Tanacetum cinerariifolium]